MENLKGKVAIITGASSGIGEVTALELTKAGAKVVLGARRADRVEALAKKITDAGGEALWAVCDVTVREQVDKLAALAHEKYGRVDILINNAGIMLLSFMRNRHVDEWDKMIVVNIKGVLYAVAAVLPIMREQKSGIIVNISSVAGKRVLPSAAVYSGTKFALNAITEGLRQELSADDGIRVTSIQPGAVATELITHVTDAEAAKRAEMLDQIRILDAQDVAAAIVFAVSQPPHVNVNEVTLIPGDQRN